MQITANKHPKPLNKPLKGGLDSPRQLIPTNLLSTSTTRLEGTNKNQKRQKPQTLGKLKPRRLLALDTETTGIDLWHGCRPFFVSVMDEEGNLQYWEWDVNPFTREVGVVDWDASQSSSSGTIKPGFKAGPPTKDREELTTLIQENDFVLHNTKFDVRALELSGFPRLQFGSCHDTLVASHVLVSNESHKLKDLSIRYLDIPDDDQQALRVAVNDARRIARQLGWAIASGPHPHFPAAKAAADGWWNYDYWLPRAVARYKWEVEGDIEYAPPEFSGTAAAIGSQYQLATTNGHPWWTVLRTYALRDVERTYPLWLIQKEQLEEQELMPIYQERLKLLEATYQMESNGVTVSKSRLKKLMKKLGEEAAEMEAKCLKLSGYKLDNLNSPKQLTGVLFGNMGVKPVKLTTKGIKNVKAGTAKETTDYSTAAETLNLILERLSPTYPTPYLPPKKRQTGYDFVWNLLGYRAREKSLDYLEEYQLRSLPGTSKDALILHPSFNPTGTDTTRFSSSGPNAQNIGKGNKRKDDPVPSLRSVLGPAQGREWYSIDYSNVELRIFVYKSGDENLINAYEQGYKVHCIFARLLWEKEYKQCEKDAEVTAIRQLKGTKPSLKTLYEVTRRGAESLFEERYYETLYQWTKNGNFSLIYGAGENKADTTYHRPGAYRLIRSQMPMIDEFMQQKHWEAKTHCYIRTLGGYKLWVPPSEPHVAVNYFVQGSAGWCMVLAINRVHQYLNSLNSQVGYDSNPEEPMHPPGYNMIMTIHDELDFDFPKHERNQEVITKVAKLMEQSGTDIGVPTPVSVERHMKNWSIGEKVKI